MNNEVKENAIVERMSPAGTKLLARVRWVNEKGEAGVTYITPDSYAGSAQVVDVEELTLIDEEMGEVLKYTSTEELKKAITRLRGMRMPAKLATRGTSTRAKKLTRKSELQSIMEKAGGELDGLIARAIKEIKEEGGDKEDGD